MPEILETPATVTPVVKEQDKAEPVLAPTVRKIDKKQRAASCSLNFITGVATLNIEEGEYDGEEFHRVSGGQVEVDLKDVATAMANTGVSTIMGKCAQFVLDKCTEEVPE